MFDVQLDGLNEQQRAAVSAGLGPVLVLAGPGSGKTRVLTHRIAYLIDEMGVSPDSIMAVTFTNKAAAEMRHRISSILDRGLQGLQIGTFHAICARILRKEWQHLPYGADYVIFDMDEQITAMTQALNAINVDTKKYAPRRVLGEVSKAKNELIAPEKYVALDYFGEIVKRAYERYQAILIDNNAMDFDDLLMQMAVLLRDNDMVRQKYQRFYEYLLVDEFQDTNTAQYELVKHFAQPHNNVFVVGDEDQGIYAFRGADYRNVLQFRHDYPQAKVILLEQNYRSKQTILDAARAVIDRNGNRTPKHLFTDRGAGEQITLYEAYNEDFEARYVVEQIDALCRKHKYNYGDFAVMYRTNAQSRAIEDICIREGIPYKLVGGVGFYKRMEIRDVLAYLRLVNNANDKMSFTRVVNVPKRGIGDTSQKHFQNWAATSGLSYDDAIAQLRAGAQTPVSNSAAKLLDVFWQQLESWREVAAQHDLVALYDCIMRDTGYSLHLHTVSKNDEQAAERHENLKEFRGLLARSQEEGLSLSDFLAEQALVSDVDSLDAGDDSVTLLTLHAAKGLEYPVVFIIGAEEGLLPHSRAFDAPEDMAEERRLLYVGLTRAMDHLYISYAFKRTTYGSTSAQSPSRFLADIPQQLLSNNSPRSTNTASRAQARYQQDTTWTRSTPAATPRTVKPDFGQPTLKSSFGGASSSSASQPSAPKKAPNDKIRSKIMSFPSGGSAEAKKRYPVGQRVFHSRFGAGLVIESRGSGDREEVTIAFENKEIKRFDAIDEYLSAIKD